MADDSLAPTDAGAQEERLAALNSLQDRAVLGAEGFGRNRNRLVEQRRHVVRANRHLAELRHRGLLAVSCAQICVHAPLFRHGPGQLGVDGHEVRRPFGHALLERAVEPPDLALGLPKLGGLHILRSAVPFGHDELVRSRDVEDLIPGAVGQRVGAEGDHALTRHRRVNSLLVGAEGAPVTVLQPGRGAVHAKAGKAPGQGFAELLVPRGRDPCGIEIARVGIPIAVSMDLDAAVVEVALETRDGPPQCLHGLFRCEGLGQDPEAQLSTLEPRLEVRQHRVQQVLLRLEEVAEVGAPGHVPHEGDAGPTQGQGQGHIDPILLISGTPSRA